MANRPEESAKRWRYEPATYSPGAERIKRSAGLGRDPFAERLDLPPLECADQVAGENGAARLPLGEPLLDELFGPPLHCLAHIGAKADLAELRRRSRDHLPVQPGRAAGQDMSLNRDVRTDGKRDAPMRCR